MQGAGRTGISPALGVTLPKARRHHAGGRLSDSHPRGAQLCPRGQSFHGGSPRVSSVSQRSASGSEWIQR